MKRMPYWHFKVYDANKQHVASCHMPHVALRLARAFGGYTTVSRFSAVSNP